MDMMSGVSGWPKRYLGKNASSKILNAANVNAAPAEMALAA
jgi:hypothetical protein